MRIAAAVIILACYFFFRYKEKTGGDGRYRILKYVMAGLAVALAIYIMIADR